MRREQLLHSIAMAILDYREGEVPKPTPEHVERWANQFDASEQVPVLGELAYVLETSYFSKHRTIEILRNLFQLSPVKRRSPRAYWEETSFLDIQPPGQHSQREMLRLCQQAMNDVWDHGIRINDHRSCHSIYVDDFIFTGDHASKQLSDWVWSEAARSCDLAVFALAAYDHGIQAVKASVNTWSGNSHKAVNFHQVTELPQRRLGNLISGRDVYQTPGQDWLPSPHEIFSSAEGRAALQRVLYGAGSKIVALSQNPSPILQPLGYRNFGTPVASFINCPNNSPLALWWGDPSKPSTHPLGRWYPLLNRRINAPNDG